VCYASRQAGGRKWRPNRLKTSSSARSIVKYPEGDGGVQLDYEWIAPEQSSHVAKVILMELAANGFEIVTKRA